MLTDGANAGTSIVHSRLHCASAARAGAMLEGRRTSGRLSFARTYLLFHFNHGSREIEGEREGGLVRRPQNAYHVLRLVAA